MQLSVSLVCLAIAPYPTTFKVLTHSHELEASGSTVTFLLRNPNVFDNDASIKQYIDSGKVRIAKGDALKEEDIKKAWDVAAEGDGPLDVVLFTVGAYDFFNHLSER